MSLTLGLALATTGVATAAEIWTDIGGTIAKFDSANPGAITYIGATGELPMDGMDFTPDGTLYGVADQELFVINQVNGSVQSLGVSQLVGDEIYMDISWDPVTQTMYGIGGMYPRHLYTIDLTDATATLLGNLNLPGMLMSGGLATDAAGVRYVDDDQYNGLFRLTGLTGTFLGPEGFDYSFFGGMSCDWSRDGTLYHLTWNLDTQANELWTVNLTTGAGTKLGTLGQSPTLSAAIKPIPEPSALVVLVLLLAAAGRGRRS
jgi:hypothetical protein